MPKYRARVECFNLPPADGIGQYNRTSGEIFCNIVNHLSSSGPDLGIEMIAANYGIGGTGLNFWDSANPAGSRSWACFRFHSASFGKFDCLVLCATGSNQNSAGAYSTLAGGTQVVNYANQGTTYSSYVTLQVLIAFAVHPSGSNTTLTDGPWNGTYSLTSASLGNPMWKVTPAGKGAFFPRQNGISGFASGSRNALAPVLDVASRNAGDATLGRKLHIVASEDSLTVIHDAENDNQFGVMHFGSFTPRSGVFCDAPYFFMKSPQDVSSNDPVQFYGSTYGGTAAASVFGNEYAGAVAHPNLYSGSRNFSFGYIAGSNDTGFTYNRFINSGTYEKNPFFMYINEAPDFNIIGTANHIRWSLGMANRAVSALSSSAAIGRSAVAGVKLLVPWSGSAPSTAPLNLQAGTNWSLDV